jgi:transaldolase
MDLKVKLFADGADKKGILEMYENPLISGFTTNPTLMKSAGIKDYEEFSKDILGLIKDKPVSLEVFSDDFKEMESQALEISSWGENVNVKIPITNTKSESSVDLIKSLSKNGVKLNVTAIMTIEQIEKIISSLREGPGGYISVFAGRIADSGKDPLNTMKKSLEIIADNPKIELIWASPRELYNVVQANDIGCHIITATNDILRKLPTLGKDLDQFSLETVKMFYDDAVEAGYSI